MIKIFNSWQAGAPVMSGSQGALINFLDKILLTGYGDVAITGITSSGLVATVTIDAGNPFNNYDTIEIAGANQNPYNGVFRIYDCANNTFKYDMTETATAASGTITARIPALGWTTGYSAEDKKVYIPNTERPVYYKVNEIPVESIGSDYSAGYNHARIHMYESMLDVDNGVPEEVLNSSIFFLKSQNNPANSDRREWYAIGDDKRVYIFVCPVTQSNKDYYYSPVFMGEFIKADPLDTYNYALIGLFAHISNGVPDQLQYTGHAYLDRSAMMYLHSSGYFLSKQQYTGAVVLRDKNSIEGHCAIYLSNGAIGNNSCKWSNYLPNNSNVTGQSYYAPVYVLEPGFIRGKMPGVYRMLYQVSMPLLTGTAVVKDINIDGTLRDLLVIHTNRYDDNYLISIDMTGPWE